jgi:hypothetical protein
MLSDGHNVISQTAELAELSAVLSSIQLGLGNVLHPTATSGSLLLAPASVLEIGGIQELEGGGDSHHDDMSAGGQSKRKQRPHLLPPSPEQ